MSEKTYSSPNGLDEVHVVMDGETVIDAYASKDSPLIKFTYESWSDFIGEYNPAYEEAEGYNWKWTKGTNPLYLHIGKTVNKNEFLKWIEWLGYRASENLQEETDYDPSWDYDVQRRPTPAVKKLVDSIMRDLNPLRKRLGFKKVNIHFIKAKNDELARYINGTMDNPHFVLNAKGIYLAAKKYGVNLGTAVETTITHEMGHAYLEMCGIDTHDHDEDVVEEFAREFDNGRDIDRAVMILDNFVKEHEGSGVQEGIKTIKLKELLSKGLE